jgi:hypothetical protein
LRGRHGRQQHDRYARWKSRSCASGTSAERQWRRVKRRQRRRLRDMARQLPAEYWPPRWRVYNLCARPILTDGFGSAPAETFGRREWQLPGSACSRTAIPLTARLSHHWTLRWQRKRVGGLSRLRIRPLQQTPHGRMGPRPAATGGWDAPFGQRSRPLSRSNRRAPAAVSDTLRVVR